MSLCRATHCEEEFASAVLGEAPGQVNCLLIWTSLSKEHCYKELGGIRGGNISWYSESTDKQLKTGPLKQELFQLKPSS